MERNVQIFSVNSFSVRIMGSVGGIRLSISSTESKELLRDGLTIIKDIINSTFPPSNQP